MAALGAFGFIIFLVVGIAQAYVGFLGIEYHFGELWAWAAIGLAFFLRIMFSLTIGTYFGAVDVSGLALVRWCCISCSRLIVHITSNGYRCS